MQTISRKDLYEAIWSRPMTKVAAEYGISDVALKKICTKHRIPVPGRGYWAKKAAEQPVRRTILRITNDPSLEIIRIFGSASTLLEPVRRARAAARAEERAPERKITVPNVSTEEMHPCAVKTAKAAEKKNVDAEGFIAIGGPGVLRMRIAPASLPRALNLANALLRAAEDRGYQVRSGENGVELIVDDEALGVMINEKALKVPHVPTVADLKEKERREKSGWNWYRSDPWPKYDHPPSGKLAVEVLGDQWTGLRRTWSDAKARPVESMLNDVLAGMVVHVAARKQRRQEEEERKRRWREEEERRIRAARLKELNDRRLKLLESVKAEIDEMDRLRNAISAIEARWPEMRDKRIVKLIEWAKAYVAERDAVLSQERVGHSVEYYRLFEGETADESP